MGHPFLKEKIYTPLANRQMCVLLKTQSGKQEKNTFKCINYIKYYHNDELFWIISGSTSQPSDSAYRNNPGKQSVENPLNSGMKSFLRTPAGNTKYANPPQWGG